MNSNFNRQFIMLDFRLLENRQFLQFIGSSEFATYLVLRRYIWRGGEEKPHYLGLHALYEAKRLLVCSVSNHVIAETIGLQDITRVSKHLAKLEEIGVIQRIRTGRESIHVLGEWLDYSERKDGSKRLEWFYLDQKFGPAEPELQKRQHQTWLSEPTQTWLKRPHHSNKEMNREENNKTVNVNGDEKNKEKKQTGTSDIIKLPDFEQPPERTAYMAQELINTLGDKHSARFYALVAGKIPESAIQQALSEIKADGANSPPKLFVFKMKQYALHHKP